MRFQKFDPKDGDGNGGDAAAAAAKVIADKAAADQVIADKVISEKAAADKVVADKAIADAAAAEAAKKGNGGDAVPETYVLKLPENTSLSDADVKAVEAFAKEYKLTQAQAEAVLKGRDADATLMAETNFKAIETQVATWDAEVKADKTLGATYEDTVRISTAGFEKAFPDKNSEVRTYLKQTGLGSLPEVVRFFYKFGLEGSEDPNKGGGGGGNKPEKTPAQRAYPDLPSTEAK